MCLTLYIASFKGII